MLARVDFDRQPHRAGKSLVDALADMVVVCPVKQLDVQGQPGGLCDGMEPVLKKLGIHLAQTRLAETCLPDQKRTARNIDSDPAQRLVHRRIRMAVTDDSRLVTQRLCQSLADRERAIFGGVVLVDMQVTVDPAGQVDQRMPRKLFDHMIEKADPGGDIETTGPVEVQLDENIGLMGLAFYTGGAHAAPYKHLAPARNNFAAGRDCAMALPHSGLTLRGCQSNKKGMSDDAPDSLIPYDEIVQEALRAVVGRVLGEVELTGLPGEHHFYITFKTHSPGVDIPRHLVERFPDEMTIVLQQKFWDLKVEKTGFSVGLSFNRVPAHLFIPFAAITAFVDPAVDFGLQFQVAGDKSPPEPHETAENDHPGIEADGSNVVSVDFGKRK